MRRYLMGGVRFFFVSVGIIVLTSVSIDATDLLRGSQSALGIFATKVVTGDCPVGMVSVEYPDRSKFCIDAYEVGAGSRCAYASPQSAIESAANSNDPLCEPVSQKQGTPWTQVLLTQADQICARVGKRLPTAEEWYLAARGTPDSPQVCNLDGGPQLTGAREQCVSGVGSFDMIGGVWEWVTPTARDGFIGGEAIPSEGYVAMVGAQGLPTQSTSTPSLAYNNDYIWSEPVGEFAVMRGGFHGSRTDGGIYTLHAATPLDFAAPTVGFRCVKSL